MWTQLKADDGHEFAAWRAGPDDAGRALVVVQEIFGVNPHIRRLCDRLGGMGWSVIAPALFDRVERGAELGYTPDDVARGRALRGRIEDAAAMRDVAAAAAVLPAGAARGVIGYCWGGTLAWWGATRLDGFAAAVGWYGGGIAASRDEVPRCPVQLHFGGRDAGIPLTDVEAVREAHPEVEVFVYLEAGHGFGCEDRDSYDPAAKSLAEARSLDFLARHLGGAA